jgi:hypothetical protein
MRPHPFAWSRFLLVAVLVAELLLAPLSAHAAGSGLTAPTTPTTPNHVEDAASVKPTPSATPSTAADRVSSSGAFVHRIGLRLPPGRNGVQPALGLSYSSDGALAVSAFGAGWSWPNSMVRRGRRHGTPRIEVANGAHRYADADGAHPVFERDGVEIVADPQSPSDSRGVVYRDRVDRSFAKSIYHAGAPTYWLTLLRDGTRLYYGNSPDGALPEAVLRDELGVSAWLLVRSEDPFGNVVDYEYEKGPSRARLDEPQLAPLPRLIRYGANRNTGAAHHAAVLVEYLGLGPLTIDHAAGHVYLDRVAQRIRVGLRAGLHDHAGAHRFGDFVEVHRYELGMALSPVTGRPVLQTVQEIASDGARGPTTRFTYEANQHLAGKPHYLPAPELLSHSGLDDRLASVMVVPGNTLGKGAQELPLGVFDPYHRPKWPDEWLFRTTRQEKAASPPAISHAFKFLDLNGDGATDILYHPNFAGGAGVAQPWMTFLRQRPNEWSLYDALYLSPPSGIPPLDPIGMVHAASEFVDLDLDGQVDRLLFSPRLEGPGAVDTFVTPFFKQLCNWWFANKGGAIDPIPYEREARVQAAFLLDQAVRDSGLKSPAWQAVQEQLVGEVMGTARLPSLGAIPGGVSMCYRVNTSANPIQVNFDHDLLPSLPNAAAPTVIIQPGRFDVPTTQPRYASPLQHFPLDPPHLDIITDKSFADVRGYPGPTSIRLVRSVQMPPVDLDGDGVPELVPIKESQPEVHTHRFGAAAYRVRASQAVHEMDDPLTATRFTSSLDQLFFEERVASFFGYDREWKHRSKRAGLHRWRRRGTSGAAAPVCCWRRRTRVEGEAATPS